MIDKPLDFENEQAVLFVINELVSANAHPIPYAGPLDEAFFNRLRASALGQNALGVITHSARLNVCEDIWKCVETRFRGATHLLGLIVELRRFHVDIGVATDCQVRRRATKILTMLLYHLMPPVDDSNAVAHKYSPVFSDVVRHAETGWLKEDSSVYVVKAPSFVVLPPNHEMVVPSDHAFGIDFAIVHESSLLEIPRKS